MRELFLFIFGIAFIFWNIIIEDNKHFTAKVYFLERKHNSFSWTQQ